MPIDVPKKIDLEKNKLQTSSAWLWLIDITISGVDSTLRFVNNNENVIYNNNTYVKCNFKLGDVKSTSAGELPRLVLSITNVDLVRYLLPYVENYDGIIGTTIITTPVNSFHLDVDMSSKAREYVVKFAKPTEKWIAFTLGAENPAIQRFPLTRYLGLYCRYVRYFKGAECRYAGVETVCNGTLERCIELSNETRFGGQAGLRSKTVRFA